MTPYIFEKLKSQIMENEEEYKKYILGRVEPKFCPDTCGYLNYTEAEQNRHKDKPNHICLKYNKRLKHEIYHPWILRCRECIDNRTLEDEVLKDEVEGRK
jgi:hypothetical protein